jgi:hypothetical protein
MIWAITYFVIGIPICLFTLRVARKKGIRGPGERFLNNQWSLDFVLLGLVLWPVVPLWVLSEISAKKFRNQNIVEKLRREDEIRKNPYLGLTEEEKLMKVHGIKNQSKNL